MRTTLPALDEIWQQQFSRHLTAQIQQFPADSAFWLGCSGGVDSLLLLYLLADLIPERLTVLTIDHGLQAESAAWCEAVAGHCAKHRIRYEIIAVQVGDGNVEQQARYARYAAFESRLQPNDILVLGHQQQDQAETVLLNLFRGAGVGGLAAMQTFEQRKFAYRHQPAQYGLWRPLLTLTRQQIEMWTLQFGLSAVDDPMNHDTDYDRVWCRQQLWSVIEARFPHMQQAIARSSRILHDAQHILHEVLQQDFQSCQGDSNSLDLDRLQQLSLARQRQVLSFWLQAEQAFCPPSAMVERLQREVIAARDDAQSVLHWQSYYFTRYINRLYRFPARCWHQWQHSPLPTDIRLNDQQSIEIALGTVSVIQASYGLDTMLLGCRLRLIARQGGERFAQPNRPTQTLKKQLNAAKIAPWLRSQVQCLMYNDVLLGVFTPLGFWLADTPFCVKNGWLPQLQFTQP